MGEQKCCSTHKVVQPWAVDTASLRELPATSPSPTKMDPLRGPSTWGVKPLPTTPVTPRSEAKEAQRLKEDDGSQLPMADDGKKCPQRHGDMLKEVPNHSDSAVPEGQDSRDFFARSEA